MPVDLISAAGLAVALFTATNLDDAFLLVAWFLTGQSARVVVVGQYVGIGLLVVASVVAALAVESVAPGVVRYLGLLPIAIGIRRLVALARRKVEEAATARPGRGVLAVAATTIANGSDNLGVYPSVFAGLSPAELAVVVVVFAVMTGLWCAAAYGLVNHPQAGAPLRRYGPYIVPFVLIAIGLAVLLGE